MKKPPYPIFFPVVPPVFSDEKSQWWWHQADINPADVGPFDTRVMAEQDWRFYQTAKVFLDDIKTVDAMLEHHPLLQAPMPQPKDNVDRAIIQLDQLQTAITFELWETNALADKIVCVAESFESLVGAQ